MCAPRYSVSTLCFYGLTRFFAGVSTKIVRGSSRYDFLDGELIQKHRKTYERKTEAPSREEQLLNFREYRLNKKVVRRKIFAFYHLPDCQRYFRLWTLTFPSGTQDYVAYKLLNTFLTRLRTECDLKNYIWVAERQKNSTLHFHLIFAQYIDVRKANAFILTSIRNAIKRGEIQYSLQDIERYNGLDVSKKCGSFHTVGKYLTKYVTKNNTTSVRLPYYCSQTISRLFTCMWVDDSRLAEWGQAGKIIVNSSSLFQTDFFSFTAVSVRDYNTVFADLFAINELIYTQERQARRTDI